MEAASRIASSGAPNVLSLFMHPLFAHQGGWDEILVVALPLLLIGSLLYIANKRVDAKLAERSVEEGQPRT